MKGRRNRDLVRTLANLETIWAKTEAVVLKSVREAGKVKKSLKGKGRCLGFCLDIQIDAVSTTKSERKGLASEVISE